MAEICLTYLNSQQVKVFSTNPSPDPQHTPFLEYSSLYWGVHAKRELSDRAKLLALKLFDDHNNHMPTKTLLQAQESDRYIGDFDKICLFSGLHYASFEMEGCDINQIDCGGSTPLMWAARNGHSGVVKMLLGRDDVNSDKQDNNSESPLSNAALNGNEGVVKILLARDDVNPDKSDNDGGTPLSWAAYNGREGVVKMLLARDDVSPDKPDKHGQTPLFWAIENGHKGVIALL